MSVASISDTDTERLQKVADALGDQSAMGTGVTDTIVAKTAAAMGDVINVALLACEEVKKQADALQQALLRKRDEASNEIRAVVEASNATINAAGAFKKVLDNLGNAAKVDR